MEVTQIIRNYHLDSLSLHFLHSLLMTLIVINFNDFILITK